MVYWPLLPSFHFCMLELYNQPPLYLLANCFLVAARRPFDRPAMCTLGDDGRVGTDSHPLYLFVT